MKSIFFILAVGISILGWSQSDYCLDFDGSDDYVEFSDILDLGTGDFTIEAWIYVESDAGVGLKIISKGPSSVGTPSNAGYGLRAFDPSVDDLDFHVGHSDGTVTVLTYNGLSLNEWHHVAGVRRAGNLFLYVDCVLVDSEEVPFTHNVDNDLPFTIGAIDKADLSSTNEYFNGMIDEVRIWNEARMAQDLCDWKDCTIDGPFPYLLAVYNMNEGSGTIVNDAAGSAYNGDLSGGPSWEVSTVTAGCYLNFSEDNSVTEVLTYPNPATTELMLENVSVGTTYRIMDVSGKMVQEGHMEDNSINISNIQTGRYFLHLVSPGSTATVSFIKI